MSLLHWNWTEQQTELHNLKVYSLNAAVAAFVTAVVHYAVSEWVWFGDGGSKRKPHRAPVYLVSSCVFFYLWSTIFNKYMGYFPLGYVIATPIVAIVGGVLLNLAFCWIWTITFPLPADHSEDKEDDKSEDVESGDQDEGPTPESLMKDTEAAPPKTEMAAAAPAAPAAPKKKPNYMYITNIKIFLTAMVLVHHCVNSTMRDNEYITTFFPAYWFSDEVLTFGEKLRDGGLSFYLLFLFLQSNTCYFMHLFFFFSGYFVPRSFDKRGTRAFLMARARRLGIPLVLLAYFFDWARYMLEGAIFGVDGFVQHYSHTLTWSPNQAWFLMSLMVYGIAYAFLCGKGWSPKVACPSILGFFAFSIVLGLIGFVLVLCFPTSPQVMNVADSPSILPGHIFFFFFGAVAQRNNWMEEIQSKSRIAIYTWATFSWLVLAGVLFYDICVFENSSPLWEAMRMGFFVYGYLCIPISLAVTVFFMDLLNKKYFFTDFFAQSMYTAYIIQRFPIVISMYLWNLVLEATDNVIMVITESNIIAIPGNMLIPGVLFMATVTMIITWPLAYAIRSIPGFSKVL